MDYQYICHYRATNNHPAISKHNRWSHTQQSNPDCTQLPNVTQAQPKSAITFQSGQLSRKKHLLSLLSYWRSSGRSFCYLFCPDLNQLDSVSAIIFWMIMYFSFLSFTKVGCSRPSINDRYAISAQNILRSCVVRYFLPKFIAGCPSVSWWMVKKKEKKCVGCAGGALCVPESSDFCDIHFVLL